MLLVFFHLHSFGILSNIPLYRFDLKRVQSKVEAIGSDCQVTLQISSNPGNKRKLSDFTIIMAIPQNVFGDTLTTHPVGGIYNTEKNSVIWRVSQLGPGEKFQLVAKFKLDKSIDRFGKVPSFPVVVRCQSLYAHLSGIVVECEDEPRGFPADVNTKVARRFRVSHRERDPHVK